MQNGLQHGDTMTEKRFENRLDKSNVKFNTLNPTWDNEKETGLNVFEMIDELNKLSDENEQLKKELKFIKSELSDCMFDTRQRTLNEVKEEIEKLERYE